MTSFRGLGIGLSLVFGCLLLALVGELYYLLWWKKKRLTFSSHTQIADDSHLTHHHSHKEFNNHLFFCCKSLSPFPITDSTRLGPDPELGLANEAPSHQKPGLVLGGEEGVEAELMRLHNLSGPPRFLFTISEETKEDLESDDGRSKGDLSFRNVDMNLTPFISPLGSPHVKSSALEMEQNGFSFNPLFEASTEMGFNRLRSSPPPKFKFLRDAEEKLRRQIRQQEELQGLDKENLIVEGSFLKFIAGKTREPLQYLPHPPPQYPSSSAQVLPLPSSPSRFRQL